MKGKKGVSPVVATLLLVLIVIVLAAIVFVWTRSFIKESVTKKGMSAKQACEEISLDVSYSANDVQIINTGNIPIRKFNIMVNTGEEIKKIESEKSIIIGGSVQENLVLSDADEVSIVPIIEGETSSGKALHICTNQIKAKEQ